MNFNLSEEHLLIQTTVRAFALRLKQQVIERDEMAEFPHEYISEMADLGLTGIMTPTRYGGAGLDTLSYVLAIEEIAKIDAATAVILSAHNSLVLYGLSEFGTELQKEKYLRPLAEGNALGAFALSEPEAGSDASSQQTQAKNNGDHYVLNGVKNWITNGGNADFYLVIAQSDPEKGHRGISAFILEKGMPGFTIGPKENKLGIRSSDTHSLMFNDVKVPHENRIGEEGLGFQFAMKTLDGGRIGIAAQALGIAAGAFELSLAYAKQRKTFGRPIAEHQAIQFKLADMETDIQAARLLTYQAAWEKDQGKPYGRSAAIAKLFASEVAMKHTVEAVQIHGGYGYVKEYHVERLMRDAKITQIYEGTSEIQRLVIARDILKD